MLELIFQGLIQWFYGLVMEIWNYFVGALFSIISMDFAYLEAHVPIIPDMADVLLAVGWALLIGNLAFQALKSMLAGIGFEAEDPAMLFTRTFVFAFLLVVSPEICEIGLNLTQTIIDLLGIPSAINVSLVDESVFGTLTAAWLLVIICGIFVMIHTLKLVVEIAERYIILAFLTLCAPLAFSMGGSKNTMDIFTGWCRMFGSMCFVMVSNMMFLKMLLSVLSTVPSGLDVFPWMVLVFGIVKVAKKIDGIISRIGLNPALTGNSLGRAMPGVLSYMVIRSAANQISSAVGKSTPSNNGSGGGKSTKSTNSASHFRHGGSTSSQTNTSRSGAQQATQTSQTNGFQQGANAHTATQANHATQATKSNHGTPTGQPPQTQQGIQTSDTSQSIQNNHAAGSTINPAGTPNQIPPQPQETNQYGPSQNQQQQHQQTGQSNSSRQTSVPAGQKQGASYTKPPTPVTARAGTKPTSQTTVSGQNSHTVNQHASQGGQTNTQQSNHSATTRQTQRPTSATSIKGGNQTVTQQTAAHGDATVQNRTHTVSPHHGTAGTPMTTTTQPTAGQEGEARRTYHTAPTVHGTAGTQSAPHAISSQTAKPSSPTAQQERPTSSRQTIKMPTAPIGTAGTPTVEATRRTVSSVHTAPTVHGTSKQVPAPPASAKQKSNPTRNSRRYGGTDDA
ncbi:hypothetical protein RFF05_14265 [Bengtsoniella intestinalis]|uniref:hypothetical protein n=1 Tax=Bengtsoniella intestinalis TaxID=3073143 RepID=UPI00391F7F6B